MNHARAGEPDAFRLLVSAYHPDALRRPFADRVATPGEHLRLALTWNVFKTLEQIAPSAWMRRLLATSVGLPDGYDSAPHMTQVTCWSDLRPAPSTILRQGRRHAIPVSVVIDTDDTLIVLLTPAVTDLHEVVSETSDAGLAELSEAAAWLAGARSTYVIVVLPIEADEAVWTSRFRRRAECARRVAQAAPKGPANLRGVGTTTWSALHDLLSELSACSFIAQAERRYASTAAAWMRARLRAIPSHHLQS